MFRRRAVVVMVLVVMPGGGVPAGSEFSGGVPAGCVPCGGVPSGGVPCGGVPCGGVPSRCAILKQRVHAESDYGTGVPYVADLLHELVIRRRSALSLM